LKSDHHAVVVGIGTYPGFTDLVGPVADARAMRDWLVDPDGGDVDPANVRVLCSDDFHPPPPQGIDDARPLDSEIRALFRPLIERGIEAPFFGQRLYIYMAGHGFSVADPARARLTGLYAANACLALAPHVVATAFAEWFRLHAVFREVILILDCCRTTDLFHDLAEPGLIKLQGRAGLSSEVRRFYACATQEGQVARERPWQGAAGQVRGIFTVTLLEALRRAPPNRLGRVTGSVVRDYVHNNMDAVAGDASVAPPEIEVDPRADVVLAERESAPRTPVRWRIDPFAGPDRIRVLAGPADELCVIEAPAAQVDDALPPGFYKAVLLGAGRQALFEVGLQAVEVPL
jgi:hypothetical protein